MSDRDTVTNPSLVDFVNCLVRMRETQHDKQPDNWPRRIDLTGAEAEFGAPGMPVMIVVKPFPSGEQRNPSDIGRRVVEVSVTDVMAETIDRR